MEETNSHWDLRLQIRKPRWDGKKNLKNEHIDIPFETTTCMAAIPNRNDETIGIS